MSELTKPRKSEVLESYARGTLPLYITAEEAAAIVHTNSEVIRCDMAKKFNPLPHRRVGNRRLVETAALRGYYRATQEATLKNYI